MATTPGTRWLCGIDQIQTHGATYGELSAAVHAAGFDWTVGRVHDCNPAVLTNVAIRGRITWRDREAVEEARLYNLTR